MSKETKIKIKYRCGKLPTELSELLSKADETDLKILVSLLMLADDNGETTDTALVQCLDIDESDVAASLKFWRGAGVIESSTSKKNSTRDASEKTSEKAVDNKERGASFAHKNGAVETSGLMKPYSAGELATIMETRAVSPQFVDEAQRVMGRMFRTYDIEVLVGIVDRLGFEEEAVLVILNYIVGKGKKTVRYAETVAMALHDEGITETVAVIDRIGRMERSSEVIEKIKSLYGIRDRALTTSEKRIFASWTENFDYDIDVIKMAYDITVDNTQKPVPKYTNGILERWYAEGVRTSEDARRFLERQAEGKQASVLKKSYNTDDFFEAALQRSFEDIK